MKEKTNEIFVAHATFSTKFLMFRGTGPEVNSWMVKQKKKGAIKVGYRRA
jgi:hypothetical protein